MLWIGLEERLEACIKAEPMSLDIFVGEDDSTQS